MSDEEYHFDIEDPSLITDPVPWHGERVSGLMEVAEVISPAFKSPQSLVERVEWFRKQAQHEARDVQDRQVVNIFKRIVERIDSQSRSTHITSVCFWTRRLAAMWRQKLALSWWKSGFQWMDLRHSSQC